MSLEKPCICDEPALRLIKLSSAYALSSLFRFNEVTSQRSALHKICIPLLIFFKLNLQNETRHAFFLFVLNTHYTLLKKYMKILDRL